MKSPIAQSDEKIYRVWSLRKADTIAVRVKYVVTERSGCRIFTIIRREQWD